MADVSSVLCPWRINWRCWHRQSKNRISTLCISETISTLVILGIVSLKKRSLNCFTLEISSNSALMFLWSVQYSKIGDAWTRRIYSKSALMFLWSVHCSKIGDAGTRRIYSNSALMFLWSVHCSTIGDAWTMRIYSNSVLMFLWSVHCSTIGDAGRRRIGNYAFWLQAWKSKHEVRNWFWWTVFLCHTI